MHKEKIVGKNVVFSNLVYGEPYTKIFLYLHLKSLLENIKNIVFTEKSKYLIYTDGKNVDQIKENAGYKALRQLMDVVFVEIKSDLSYNKRYSVQSIQFQHSVDIAIKQDSLFHHAAADIYYGKNFWNNCFAIFERESIDAIFGHAIRSTYDAAGDILASKEITNDELYDIAFRNLHPLWAFGIWGTPLFTKIPYNLLWTDGEQIICRGFSIPPLLFKPNKKMAGIGGCSDITVKRHCDAPYFENDWSSLPCVGLEQLTHFFPVFQKKRSSVEYVTNWARKSIIPDNYKNIEIYQVIKKTDIETNMALVSESRVIADNIVRNLLAI